MRKLTLAQGNSGFAMVGSIILALGYACEFADRCGSGYVFEHETEAGDILYAAAAEGDRMKFKPKDGWVKRYGITR